ncbi:MAG: hypothetical protein ACOX5G_02345 [Kiritimatiellia bacterium]|jgi:hypothetical protein
MKRRNWSRILAASFIGFAVTATANPTGVTVNGTPLESGGSPGEGWAYDSATFNLALFGEGPFTLSGTNTQGKVRVVVPAGVTNAVTLSNLHLQTLVPHWEAPPDNVCGFALETNACVLLFLEGENLLWSTSNRAGVEVPEGASLSITNAPGDSAGALLAHGGYKAAGIGGGQNKNGGTVAISGGTVTAEGGIGGAGIGGGQNKNGGTVAISGGTVTAEGGSYGAGIGGGGNYNNPGGSGGSVTISGGIVTATGGSRAAGIGGGNKSAGGTVGIEGGTVFAQGGNGGADIGPGRDGAASGTNVFTGGTICPAASFVAPTPSNGTVRVACAVVAGFAPNEAVEIAGLLPPGYAYGVEDIVADDGGGIYLWLPDGNYAFAANDRACTVKVENGIGPVGVTVNGEEIGFGPAVPHDAGWHFDATNRLLTLNGRGPFTLSGANSASGVRVDFVDYTFGYNEITFSNLTIRTVSTNRCAFALGQNADVSLFLAGKNVLVSGSNRAGLEVGVDRTVFITNVYGVASASLSATGGNRGAGIGGGYNESAGTIWFAGGAITATSDTTDDFGGAGVGGGGTTGGGLGGTGPVVETGGAGGIVTVSGGTLTATGGNNATGIGGGSQAPSGTLTVYGGTVVATGNRYGAGVGSGERHAGGAVTVEGGSLTAVGGEYAAGIGGGCYASGTSTVVVVHGGLVTAKGGPNGGAGIGGGANGADDGGTVRVYGGKIVAEGGHHAAGIGGGEKGSGGVFVANGGRVLATGGNGAAGIGGGHKAAGGFVEIVGGTVFAQGAGGGADIGPGLGAQGGIANTFTGGSIRLAGSSIAPDPKESNFPVFCVVVTGFEPNERVTMNDFPANYGTNDLFADEVGCIYLWLLSGDYDFTANDRGCTARVWNGVGSSGVTVDGEDVAFGPVHAPPGNWSFDGANGILTLTGTGPFTLSGVNVISGVRVVVPHGVGNTVVLSNLTLRATGYGHCAFELQADAVVSLVLAGANTLVSGEDRAGLEVSEGRTLFISHALGDATASLAATGGSGGAGIGGSNNAAGGAVAISGGRITATGGTMFAAGIGGGGGGAGGAVAISGGTVVAQGADYGAGIGTGGYSGGYGGTLIVHGGSLEATGGELGAGIGGGDGDAGGTVTITGGTVSAAGGDYAAGIGSGNNDENPAPLGGGTMEVSGGRVTATGGRCAAGIGGGAGQTGAGGRGAALTVDGGTLFATGGPGGGPGVGSGLRDVMYGESGDASEPSGTSLFTGGSIRIDGGYAAAGPDNGMVRVWCVTVPHLAPNAAIEITLLDDYGTADLFADEAGKLYLWLPNGSCLFKADDVRYTATVTDAPTTAILVIDAPVFALDGTALVIGGDTLTVKIINAQKEFWYTLHATETLGDKWVLVDSVCATDDGDLIFHDISATVPRRFFKVTAGTEQPEP